MPHARILSMDSDEHIEHQIVRHSIGLFFIYFITFIVLVGIFFIILGIDKYEESLSFIDSSSSLLWVAITFGLLTLVMGGIGGMIYNNNLIIITNENIVQSRQNSLFSRKVSQLSLAKIQDVTVVQDGVLSSVFGFGTIIIETAGEEANFSFPFAVKPYEGAKHIIEAHERFSKEHGQQNDF